MDNSGGLAASLASPGRARAFCFSRRLEKRRREGRRVECLSLWISMQRTYVLWSRGCRCRTAHRHNTRSYNIATPRNDIKLSQQWIRDLPALTAVKSGPFRTLQFAMKILLNAQAHRRLDSLHKRMFFVAPKLRREHCHFHIVIVIYKLLRNTREKLSQQIYAGGFYFSFLTRFE